MVAPTAYESEVVTTNPEFGLDLSRPISTVGEHIIAGVAPCPTALPAPGCRARPHRSPHNAGSACACRPRSHGSCSRRIDCVVERVGANDADLARDRTAMLLHPARIAILLPHFGELLLPPRWCAPSLQLGVLVTTVPLRRHRHNTGVDDLPATRHVALGRKMLVEAVKQLFDQPGLGKLLAEQPKRRGVRNAVLDREPQKARERQPVAHLIFHLLVRQIVERL